MRLALQALFSTIEANEEGTARRALLERRLRANERSAGFFRRLRDVVDDETLQAPEVFAEESFPDANVVAEYLDAQAPSELASVYEDACWNSPEILAEIGRCYDILNSDALSSVVAPKNCRRRLYYIAWEENAVDVSTKERSSNAEADESILTDFAPTVSENVDEVETFEGEKNENCSKDKENERNSKPKAKGKKRAIKPAKTEKSAKSVGLALAAERSWGRRFKRLSGRFALTLGLLGACYCGWQALDDDKRSETLQLATSKEELGVANAAVEQNINEEAPLRPTTISSANFGEPSTASLPEEFVKPTENGTNDGRFARSTEKKDPYKLAALPNLTNESEIEPRPADSTKAGTARLGLTEGDPWERRPSLEIPAQNNDVFGKTALY